MRFPHLNGRADKLIEELDLPAETAEWLAVAALHSGCFLRTQYSDFYGLRRQRTADLVIALSARNLVVEMPVEGMGLLSRITNKRIYRALGAANIRHRRLASWPIVYRRLLSLDYVLDHPELPWLPTEAEKLACFDGLAIPRNELPSRVYGGAIRSVVRYFANKHPVAVDSHAKAAVFVYADSDERSPQGLRSWRDEHAALWSRLASQGFTLRIVHVGRNPQLAESVQLVFETWSQAPTGSAKAAQLQTELQTGLQAELARVREALEKDDTAVLDTYGGFNKALRLSVDLKRRLEGRSAIGGYKATYEVWLSERILPQGKQRNPMGSHEAAAGGGEE